MLWASDDQDAESRSDGGGGDAVHGFLCSGLRVHAEPGGVVDGAVADPERDGGERETEGHLWELDRRFAAGGDHNRAGGEVEELRDVLHREMAPGAFAAVYAFGAWV